MQFGFAFNRCVLCLPCKYQWGLEKRLDVATDILYVSQIPLTSAIEVICVQRVATLLLIRQDCRFEHSPSLGLSDP